VNSAQGDQGDPNCSPIIYFVKINEIPYFFRLRNSQFFWWFNNNAQSKQLPEWQNFSLSGHGQCCQMAYFNTSKPYFLKFWRALEWKMLVYFMLVWNILRSFAKFYGHLVNCVGHLGIIFGHWVYISPFWYIWSRKIWQPWSHWVRPTLGDRV
jgi:hypothetical protein